MAIEPGDWVEVWGQVTEDDLPTPPGDILVRLISTVDTYTCAVRRDRVTKPEGLPPEFVPRCSALTEVVVRFDGLDAGDAPRLKGGDEVFLRCTKHDGHGGKHKHRGMKWESEEIAGYFEEG